MSLPESTAFASLSQLGTQLREKELTSVQLTEFFLRRCETLGPTLNAVVTVSRQRALKQAKRADDWLAAGKDLGPLHGIPFGVKDLLSTKGVPTSWGAAPYQNQLFDADATVVSRLENAGGVLVAKLAMVELAGGMGYRQANASFTGPGLNPWGKTRWSGGSSSGSGSAVGGGLVPFAIGSETWGSITTPSSYCGISGLRPTYGRVSRHGAMALSWTMDKLGPMAHSAHDCGLILNAIAGKDHADPSCVDRPYEYPTQEVYPAPFRIATLKGATTNLQPEVEANYKASLEVLKKFCRLEETTLPDLPYREVASTIISCELAAAFQGMVRSGDNWELTAPEDHFGAYSSLLIPAVDYINALRIRAPIQQALDELFTRYDAIVTPTLATVAPPIDRPFRDYVRGFVSTAIGGAGNVAGLPGISVPNGFGEEGLPTGLQFVGRAFEENRLLEIAHRYQRATDFHKQVPKLTSPEQNK